MAKTITNETVDRVQYTPTTAKTAGDVVVLANRVGIVLDDIAANETGVLLVRNVEAKVTKTSGVAWTEGMRIYYDPTAGEFKTVMAEGGYYAGLATRAAGSSATTGYIDLNAPQPNQYPIHSIRQNVVIGDFTDGGGTSGYVDLTTQLPAGALPLGWKAKVNTGFTGDTTAVVQVGVSGDVDRFSAVTDQSVLAAATVGSRANADGADGINAAQTIRVTVTGASDFGLIAAGDMDIEAFYIPTL